jgi:hypothetical protein
VEKLQSLHRQVPVLLVQTGVVKTAKTKVMERSMSEGEMPTTRIRQGTLLKQDVRTCTGRYVACSLTAGGDTPDSETLAEEWLAD